MRAQGLSVSFVVVAALAILILVLAVAFVMGWFHSGAQQTSMQNAKQSCMRYCNAITTALANKDCTTGKNTTQQESCVKNNATNAWDDYCNTKFNVGGTAYNCTQLYPCSATDATGNSIPITCTV